MKRAFTIALLLVASVPLLIAVSQLPPVGSTDNPSYTHVVPRYLEEGEEEAGAENIVTAIILNYRGYDTSGEVTVIFTALMAVAAVLAMGAQGDRRPLPVRDHPVSPVVAFIVRVLAPFILMFSVYMILMGHSTPGGGFQGGAILGALAILSSLVLRTERPLNAVPEGPMRALQATAVIAFAIVGTAGLAFGAFLTFPSADHLHWLRTALLIFLEAGIGIGGALVIASIFRLMEGDR